MNQKMTIFNVEDEEAYYEANEAHLVVLMNEDESIKEIYGLFEKRSDARNFALEFAKNNEQIRVMPIPFLRSKK